MSDRGTLGGEGLFLAALRRSALRRCASVPPRNSFAVFREFLPPRELEAVTHFTLARESLFRPSGVLNENVAAGAAFTSHRRSLVLYDLGDLRRFFLERLLALLPQVLTQFRIRPFAVSAIDTQITATNNLEFFRRHTDNGHPLTARRRVSFTWFFHHEPAGFTGGELILYGSGVQKIIPRRNSIVFFPSGILHEIAPVSCISQTFQDSRFTVNGWVYE
jgi:SM-20-related protein